MMSYQGIFDFSRADSMPTNIDDVIDPTCDLDVAVLVEKGAITGEIVPYENVHVVTNVRVRLKWFPHLDRA